MKNLAMDKVGEMEALPEKQPVKEITSFACGGHTRHWILVLGTLSLAIVLGCAISFNPAIVVMMDLHSSPLYLMHNNSSGVNNNTINPTSLSLDYNSWDLPLADRRFAYTNTQKMLLLASAFGGCLICFLPITICMQRFGAWRTQLAIGIVVSLSTALIPIAATSNFYLLCVVRFFTGTAFTNLFPVWVYPVVCSHKFPLAGILAQTVGWPWVFYSHAFLGFFIFSLWAVFYRDHPQVHSCVSEAELQKIEFGQQAPVKHKEYKPPYTQILSTSSIWAILIAVIGNFSIIQFANTFLPMFLRTALNYSISTSGLVSAIPLFFQFIVKWVTGYTTDHLTSVSDLVKVKFCNSVSFCGAALFFLIAIFLPPGLPTGCLWSLPSPVLYQC
uniref:Uncharacterized protein n=1 Tax=Ditylenchus dipsaci TaxID=166011 RepID=A0A915DMM3_9BILA